MLIQARRYDFQSTRKRKGEPMTVTLDLSPEQESRLQAQAQTQGKPLEVYLREAIDRLAPPTLTAKQKAAIALLDSWRQEDATDDAAELARREAELAEFQAGMNANRADEGRPPVYP